MKSRISCAPRRFDERIATTSEEAHALHYRMPDPGRKAQGSWFGNYAEAKEVQRGANTRYTSSRSQARKAASAQIAKIPYALASHIARVYIPSLV
jgi:hypothetical protein